MMLLPCRPDIGLKDFLEVTISELFLLCLSSDLLNYSIYFGSHLLSMSNKDSTKSSWSNAASRTEFYSIPNVESIFPSYKSAITAETSNMISPATCLN